MVCMVFHQIGRRWLGRLRNDARLGCTLAQLPLPFLLPLLLGLHLQAQPRPCKAQPLRRLLLTASELRQGERCEVGQGQRQIDRIPCELKLRLVQERQAAQAGDGRKGGRHEGKAVGREVLQHCGVGVSVQL